MSVRIPRMLLLAATTPREGCGVLLHGLRPPIVATDDVRPAAAIVIRNKLFLLILLYKTSLFPRNFNEWVDDRIDE
eukprot:CAMPEP_0194220514 /NCGR_PEP_ID=MMETSP0156-20130528/28588_1 /TAXON_ID=33649 /ORGANISM="Thalassionema nitzschioides, Strain L26-B" /LENGTH=75 /DNA_ID=CAMNT_0038950585 /DNA_START=54 /DNA_END=278 /DNA_ORIENTATION=-